MTPTGTANPLLKWSFALLLLLSLLPAHLSEATEPPLDPRQTKAYQLYSSGDAIASIQQLKEILADSIKTGDQNAVLDHARELVDFCTRALDLNCVQTETPVVTKLFATKLNEPYPVGLMARIWGTFYIGNLAYLSGDPNQMQQVLTQFFANSSDSPNDYFSYVRRRLLVAHMRLFLHEPREAVDAVNDALSMIAATTKPQGWRFSIADWLSQCIVILADAGDTPRAAGLYDVSGNFIARTFSTTTPEYFYFKLYEADLLLRVGNTQAAAVASKSALDSLASQKLQPGTARYLEEVVRNSAALNLTLSGDAKSALEQLERHPINRRLIDLKKRGSLESQNEVTFMATRGFVRAVAGLKSDPTDVALLAAPLNVKVDALTTQALELYRQLGYAAAIGLSDLAKSRSELRKAGQDLIALQESAPRAGFNIVTRTNPILGLVVDLALVGMSNNGMPSPNDADEALKLIDLGTRNARSLDSEILTLLGGAPSSDSRDLIHDALRLYANRNRAEQHDIAKVVQVFEQPSINVTDQVSLQRDYLHRTVYSEYTNGLLNAEKQIATLEPSASKGQMLVSVDELRRVLRPHEVYILLSAVLGNYLLYECVTADRARLYYLPFDPNKFRLDTRILVDALTAVRPASLALDSQYPTGAALRLYDTLVRPLEACIADGDTILWAPDTSMVPVPLAALLKTAPDATRPLGEADWLVKHYNVSYIKSPASLVALRRMEHTTAYASSGFLGIGDPLLTGASPNGNSSTLAQTSDLESPGTSHRDIFSLPKLPDTRQELQASAEYFANSVLLLGETATEANFRRQPLSEFRYLSVATHGVLREEIPGIREPTLVLTPTTSKDSEDDGLLTVPEIADLRLHASFVALSACSTANYDFARYAGEVTGFSTALAEAGVPATLATLWPVESETSKRIVSRVFQILSRSPDSGPAVAVATAQREFLAATPDTAHGNPRFWAPFIILGDGGTQPSDNQHAPRDIRLTGTHQLTVGGGELSTVALLKDGTTFVTGYGDRGATRYASIIAAIAKDGSTLWRHRDYVGLGSHAVVGLASGIVSANVLGMGKSSAPKSVAISITSYAGKQTTALNVPEPVHQVSPLAATAVGADESIVAVWESNQGEASNAPVQQGVRLLAISGAGRLRSNQVIDLSSKDISTYYVRGNLGVTSRTVVLAVSSRSMQLNPNSSVDESGERVGCVDIPKTWIYWLDLKTLKVIGEKVLEGTEIRTLMTSRNGRLLAGSTIWGECGTNSRAALFQIGGPSTVASLFQEDQAGETTVSALTELADGDIIIAGMTKRRMDVDPVEDRGVGAMQKVNVTDSLTKLSFSSRARTDLFIGWLDNSGHQKATKEISFGSDVYVDAAAAAGQKVVLAGSVGSEAYLIDLGIPNVPPSASGADRDQKVLP